MRLEGIDLRLASRLDVKLEDSDLRLDVRFEGNDLRLAVKDLVESSLS